MPHGQPKRGNELVSVRFAVTYGVVAAFIVLILTFAYVFVPEALKAPVIFFVAACAAAGQLGAALYSARILQFTMDSHREANQKLAIKEEALAKRSAEDAAGRFGERCADSSDGDRLIQPKATTHSS